MGESVMDENKSCGDCLWKSECRYVVLGKKCSHYIAPVKPESMLTTIKTKP